MQGGRRERYLYVGYFFMNACWTKQPAVVVSVCVFSNKTMPKGDMCMCSPRATPFGTLHDDKSNMATATNQHQHQQRRKADNREGMRTCDESPLQNGQVPSEHLSYEHRISSQSIHDELCPGLVVGAVVVMVIGADDVDVSAFFSRWCSFLDEQEKEHMDRFKTGVDDFIRKVRELKKRAAVGQTRYWVHFFFSVFYVFCLEPLCPCLCA